MKCRECTFMSDFEGGLYRCTNPDSMNYMDYTVFCCEDEILEQPTIEPEPHMPEIIRCKECKHFHYDMPYVIQGVPVLGHEVCDFWGDGCKTAEDGFCSFAERKVKNERPRND